MSAPFMSALFVEPPVQYHLESLLKSPTDVTADSKIVDVFRKNWDLRNAPDMMALNLIG